MISISANGVRFFVDVESTTLTIYVWNETLVQWIPIKGLWHSGHSGNYSANNVVLNYLADFDLYWAEMTQEWLDNSSSANEHMFDEMAIYGCD